MEGAHSPPAKPPNTGNAAATQQQAPLPATPLVAPPPPRQLHSHGAFDGAAVKGDLHQPARPASPATSHSSQNGGSLPTAGSDAELQDWLRRSPFVDLTHGVTLYEGIKLVLMAPIVAFKLLVLACVAPFAWGGLWLLLVGHQPQTPMLPLRQFLVRHWIHLWGRFLLLVAGFYQIPVHGWHNIRAAEECRAILVFNHPSYVDAAAIATFFTPSGVSKAGVADIPCIGLFAQALQLFFVERTGSSDKANKHVLRGDAVQAIAERAVDRRFPLLALAPEATTKAQPCLLSFRRGAFTVGRPVCPVLLRYRFRHCNPGWGEGNTLFHVYRLLAQFVNHLDVEVLPPYHPSGDELADWHVYAANVRQLMGQRLGVPLVDQGLADERQLWRLGASVNLRGTAITLAKKKAD